MLPRCAATVPSIWTPVRRSARCRAAGAGCRRARCTTATSPTRRRRRRCGLNQSLLKCVSCKRDDGRGLCCSCINVQAAAGHHAPLGRFSHQHQVAVLPCASLSGKETKGKNSTTSTPEPRLAASQVRVKARPRGWAATAANSPGGTWLDALGQPGISSLYSDFGTTLPSGCAPCSQPLRF